MGQAVEPLGRRVLFGVGAVDAIDIGSLQHGLGADFGRPQHRGGVGREEGIAGSTAEQHDSSFGEVLVRRAAGEKLRYFGHHEG